MPIPVDSSLVFRLDAGITGLQDGAVPSAPATVNQLTNAVNNLNWKDNARAMPPGNISLSAPGATADGVTLANGDPLLLGNQTNQVENGRYIWTGTAIALTRSPDADTFAKLESAVIAVDEGTIGAGTRWRQTQVNGVIGTNNIVFVPDGSSAPAASETTSGIAEVATQVETDGGADDLRFITSLKLKNSPYAQRTLSQTIGDGSTATFSVTHSFNTFDVEVSVREATGTRRKVIVETDTPDVNTARVLFASAPTASAYRVTVQKVG